MACARSPRADPAPRSGSGGTTPACTRTSPSPSTPTRSPACTAGIRRSASGPPGPEDRYADIHVDFAKARDVYRKWLALDTARERRAPAADLAVPSRQAGARRLSSPRRSTNPRRARSSFEFGQRAGVSHSGRLVSRGGVGSSRRRPLVSRPSASAPSSTSCGWPPTTRAPRTTRSSTPSGGSATRTQSDGQMAAQRRVQSRDACREQPVPAAHRLNPPTLR